MDILTDEHERDEAVRKWWHEHWKPIVLGVAIAIAGMVGFKQYQAYQLSSSQEVAYEVFKLQTQLASRGVAVENEIKQFIESNKDIYGSILALDLASTYIRAEQYDKALDLVNFAKTNGGKLLAPQSSLVLARLQAQLKQYDEAIKSVESIKTDAYKAEALEVKGDILMAKGDEKSAHDAYLAAINHLKDNKIQISPMLQMKFDNVIAVGDKPAYKILSEQVDEANNLLKMSK